MEGSYRIKGKALAGDVDGDGKGDRVTLRVDRTRPARCRHLVVVEAVDTFVAPVRPLAWPGTDPQLLLLAQIDGRPGLEPVVALSPAAVYRPGAAFALWMGKPLRLRLEKVSVPELFPFYDEFPAGVDCAGRPGAIVVTQSRMPAQDDKHWHVVRSFYRTAGAGFELVRKERFTVAVGPEAGRRWPEVRGDPFLHCRDRVS